MTDLSIKCQRCKQLKAVEKFGGKMLCEFCLQIRRDACSGGGSNVQTEDPDEIERLKAELRALFEKTVTREPCDKD